MKSSKDTEWVMIESSDEFEEALKIAVEDEYDSVILDQAGGFQMILLKETLQIKNVPVQLSWGLAKQQDWLAVGANFKEHVNRLLCLADTHQKNCVVLSHERNLTKEEEMERGIPPMMGPGVTPAAALWLNGAVDYLCQTYIREKVEVKETKLNGVVKVTSKPTGKMEYCLRVMGNTNYMIGFRIPLGQEEPKEDIVNPTYEKMVALINGE